MIRLFFLAFFFVVKSSFAQLGFCEGSKGDPIFQEDFGSGAGYGTALATGITSYNFVTQDPQDGEYTVSDIVGRQITSWHSYFPNTTLSGGRALIVNAGFTSGQFYKTNISGLCENTTYEFSAYLMNIYNSTSGACPNGDIPVNVKFQIWDETDTQLLKEGSTAAIPASSTPEWEQFALTFKSEAGQNNVILKIFNNGDGGCGNDLAIDDIIFRSCGDLTSIDTDGATNTGITICEEDAPVTKTLVATPDNSVYQTHAYQWQQSANGEDWVNIAGATQSEFTIGMLSSSNYYRIKVAEDVVNLNNNLCSSFSEAFFIEILKEPDTPISEGDKFICEGEVIPRITVVNAENVRINWYSAAVDGVLLKEDSFSYQPEEAGVFYAEAENADYDCNASARTPIRVVINDVPVLEDEELQLCPDSALVLDTKLSGYTYIWSTGESTQSINVSQSGTYSVEVVTDQACSSTKIFAVVPVDNASIGSVKSDENTVIITPANTGIFEYSLDGINFQSSNVFLNVPSGVYTAYMRDLSACKTVLLQFPHIVVSKMISPNGDGYNDSFKLKGLEFFPSSEIMIFDRYGKLLKSGNGVNFSWNGSFNGTNLPASDYWYHIKIEGYATLKGHFSLMR
ncbi:T9SS type B sorting domain-containing protein [Gillisia hiemivivida]|uniref:T9SS type B sorting domain-containing protein n=1 Tax=Gillisia hiemivivida TaxID=291190 RepID=A0A5C6ZTX9_9FLAO|nr:T9SS type B sorting domain-containing protein [Gillisia hiemivivida]TXD93606.1 T9SS type B sorting domain-containing protein [Gillisia hiemivivida]